MFSAILVPLQKRHIDRLTYRSSSSGQFSDALDDNPGTSWRHLSMTSGFRRLSLAIGVIALAVFLTSLWPLAVVASVVVGGRVLSHISYTRSILQFEREYPAMLLALTSSLRSGADPITALAGLDSLFPHGSPVAQSLEEFREQLHRGDSEEEALALFAHRYPHPDLTMLRTALRLARTEGTSLSPTLYRLVRVTRSRQSLRRKTRAAVMSQRLSSIGIGCIASLILVGSAVAQPHLIQEALAHPLGGAMLLSGTILVVVGVSWTLVLTRSKV